MSKIIAGWLLLAAFIFCTAPVIGQGVPGVSNPVFFTASSRVIGTPQSLGTPGTAASSATVTMITGVNIVLGDLVCLSVGFNSSTAILSVSDGTNSYSKILGANNATGRNELWCKINAAAVSIGGTVTVTSAGTFSQVAVGGLRVSGVISTNVAVTSNSNPVATGTLASASQLLIGSVGGFNLTGFTEDTNYTAIYSQQQAASQVWGTMGWRKVSSTASTNYQPTPSPAPSNAVYAVASFQ